ncbi:CsbD family protein [Streptomyces sp. NPDC017941]|uniref:CsbD family protein n=1 Tax=unclassified Streptomyces TaxID=2593676 RepID=UPI0037AB370C
MGDNAMDKAKGKAKEMVGKATGNDRMKTEGKTDQAKGKVRDATDNARAKAEGVRDSLSDRDDDNR